MAACRPPNWLTAVSARRARSSSRVTSQATARAPKGSAMARTPSTLRAASTSLAPSRAKRRAVAAPMLRSSDAPRITTTLSCNLLMNLTPLDTVGRGLLGGEAAIHHEFGAGDVLCLVGGEEQHAVGDVIRLPHEAHGDGGVDDVVLLGVVADGVLLDVGPDHPGVNGIAADPVLGPLDGDALAEQPHRALAGGVGRHPGNTHQPRHRRQVDDGTTAVVPH